MTDQILKGAFNPNDSLGDPAAFNSQEMSLSVSSHNEKESQYEKILQIVTKPKKERDEDDIDFIKSVFQTLPFFLDSKADETSFEECLEHFAAAMNHERFKKGEAVFHCGEKGTKLYLILKGQVDIYMPKDLQELANDLNPKPIEGLNNEHGLSVFSKRRGTVNTPRNGVNDKSFDALNSSNERRNTSLFDPQMIEKLKQTKHSSHHKSISRSKKRTSSIFLNFPDRRDFYFESDVPKFKKIRSLHQGDIFGELALSSDMPRSGTVIAATNLDVVSLPKAIYKTIFNDLEKHLRRKWEFFSEMTGNVSREAVLKFCYGFKERRYRYDQIIFSQGQIPKEVFLVRDGEVQILKNDVVHQEDHNKLLPHFRKVKKHEIQKKLVNLGPYNFFGEGDALLNKPYEFTAKSVSNNTIVYALPLEELQILKKNYAALWESVLDKHKIKMSFRKDRDTNISKMHERLGETKTTNYNTNTSREENDHSMNYQSGGDETRKNNTKLNIKLKPSYTNEEPLSSEESRIKVYSIDSTPAMRRSLTTKNAGSAEKKTFNESKLDSLSIRRDSSCGPLHGNKYITEVAESKFKPFKKDSFSDFATCPTENSEASPQSQGYSPFKKKESSEKVISKIILIDEIVSMERDETPPQRQPRPYEIDSTKTKTKGVYIPNLYIKKKTSSLQAPSPKTEKTEAIISPVIKKDKLPIIDTPKQTYFSFDEETPNKHFTAREARKSPTFEAFTPQGNVSARLLPMSTQRLPTGTNEYNLLDVKVNLAELELKSPFASKKRTLAISINSLKTGDTVYNFGSTFKAPENAPTQTIREIKAIPNSVKKTNPPSSHRMNTVFPSKHNMFRVKPMKLHVITTNYNGEIMNPSMKRSKK